MTRQLYFLNVDTGERWGAMDVTNLPFSAIYARQVAMTCEVAKDAAWIVVDTADDDFTDPSSFPAAA